MAQVIAVVSLGLLLAAAFVWTSWEPRTGINSGADPSLSISDIMLKVDAKSLPAQGIEDRAVVFLGRESNQ